MAVPGTPSTLSGLSATALRRIAYDSKLRVEAVLPSVFTTVKSSIKIDKNEISVLQNGVMLDITNVGKAGHGQSVVVGMRLGPRKKPKYGPNQTLLGNEDEQTLRWTRLYYNEVKKALKHWDMGYNYNDTEYLNFVETNGPALSRFMAELFDTRCQQALLLTYAEELINTPVSLSQMFNKNWIIPNLDSGNYPAWDVTAPTRTDGAADTDEYYSSRTYSGGTSMAENIADAIIRASGTGSTPLNLLKTDWVAQISYYAAQILRLEPLMIDNIPTYLFLLHPFVKSWMMNPNNTSSPANNIADIMEYKDPKRMSIPGEFGRLFESLLCVVNHRAPTIVIGGSDGSYTIKPGYMWPSNNDDRNTAAWSNSSGSPNYAHAICYVLGANALAKYTRDDLKTNLSESTEYGFIKGLAAYLGEGVQIPAFDLDTPTDTTTATDSQVQHGSAVVPVGWAPIATISS